MDQNKIQQVRDKQAQDSKAQVDEFKNQKQASRLVKTVKDSNSKIVQSFNVGSLAVVKTNQRTTKTLEKVNADLNKSLKDVAQQISQMASSLKTLEPIPNDDTNVVSAIKQLESAISKLPSQIDIPEQEKVEEVKISNQVDYSKQFESILKALKAIDIKPSVNVDVPKLDLSGVTKAVEGLQKTVVNTPAPVVNVDMQEVVGGLKQVVNTVAGLKFPIPNYVLPFRNPDGTATQAYLDANGNLAVSLGRNQTIRFASISVSASGDSQIVALTAAKKVKVLSVALVASGTVSIKWRSNTTDISGALPLVANSGFILPASSPGQGHYFETAAGEALNINLSGAVAVNGHISYYTEA